MTVNTPAGSPWPARLAYAAAGLFSGASGVTNLLYGIAKGIDFGSSLVWASVSVAVSIVFALSWPATIISADRKQWSRMTMAVIALLLTGTYSVTAALGSAMGGRASAAIEAEEAKDRKAKAQAKWDTAKAELDKLSASAPAAELQALIDNAKADLAKVPSTRTSAEIDALIRGAASSPRGAHGCTAINGSLRMICPKLEAEKARAAQRERLTGSIASWTAEIAQADQRLSEHREKAKATMDAAAAELAKAGPAKVANSDAVALATYVQGLGFEIDADRINKLLVLLAVLVIECGSGLSLAVGLSLSRDAAQAADTAVSAQKEDKRTPSDRGAGHDVPVVKVAEIVPASNCPPPPDTTLPPSQANPASSQSVSAVRLLDFIRDRGGVLSSGQRTMARALGWSKSRLHEVLHELAGEGAVDLRTDKTGTIVRLAI
jgi:hypothetical protein